MRCERLLDPSPGGGSGRQRAKITGREPHLHHGALLAVIICSISVVVGMMNQCDFAKLGPMGYRGLTASEAYAEWAATAAREADGADPRSTALASLHLPAAETSSSSIAVSPEDLIPIMDSSAVMPAAPAETSSSYSGPCGAAPAAAMAAVATFCQSPVEAAEHAGDAGGDAAPKKRVRAAKAKAAPLQLDGEDGAAGDAGGAAAPKKRVRTAKAKAAPLLLDGDEAAPGDAGSAAAPKKRVRTAKAKAAPLSLDGDEAALGDDAGSAAAPKKRMRTAKAKAALIQPDAAAADAVGDAGCDAAPTQRVQAAKTMAARSEGASSKAAPKAASVALTPAAFFGAERGSAASIFAALPPAVSRL